jgi:hypothetical protein
LGDYGRSRRQRVLRAERSIARSAGCCTGLIAFAMDPRQGEASARPALEALTGRALLAEEVKQITNALEEARAAATVIADAFPLPFLSAVPVTPRSLDRVLAELARVAGGDSRR